jgi:superfamily II DNA or RNA helicase
MQTSLSTRGYGVPKDALAASELQALKKELTVSPVNHMLPPGSLPSFPLFLESSRKVYVPKFFGLERFGAPAEERIPAGADIDVNFTGSMRAEQMKPVDAYLQAAADPLRRGGILSLPCGSGKTVIALHIVSRLRKKTLIIVHKDFLLQQWRERIEEFMPGASVGLIKAKHLDVAGRDIIIASLQSLAMKTYSDGVFADVGLVVIDEVHRTGTEVFSRALQKINFRYSLGLSATVNRKDGLTKAFTWFIGDIVYKVARRTDEMDVVMREFYSPERAYSDEVYSYGSKLNTSRMLNNVCDFGPRNRMIADIMTDVFERSGGTRRFLVLSDRKSQLATLKELLDAGQKLTSGYYIGGMKPSALEDSLKKEVILATYSFASEGFDAQHLDTLILASPKTDIEQSVGRILRVRGPDRVNVPLVVDVVDAFSMFERQGDKRRRFYKKHGYSIYRQDAECRDSVLSCLKRSGDNDDDDDDHDDDTDKNDNDDGANSGHAKSSTTMKKSGNSKKVELPAFAFID